MPASSKRLCAAILVVVLAVSFTLPVGAAPGGGNGASDDTTARPGVDRTAAAVQLQGESLATVAGSPLVQRAEYEGLYYPTSDDPTIPDPDLSIISATQAWSAGGGVASAGAGVRVAIVDTGIDVTHPCFSDAG